MTRAFFTALLLCAFIFISCDGSAVKSTRPKNDSDGISQTDKDNEADDTENDNFKDDNVKPDEDTGTTSVCGDGEVTGKEICEPEDVINCVEINEKLYEGGKAKCLKDCSGWDTQTCDEVFMECGNDIVEGIEVCDNNVIACNDLDPEKYESGTAVCGLLCDSWNESECVLYKSAVCGDGEVTGKEVCEKNDVINCVDINSALYESGKAKCLENCTGWDTETCVDREIPDDDTVCYDECSKVNSVTCLGSKVMKCTMSGGCLKWIENKDCFDTSRFCADGNTVGFGTTGVERSNVFRGNFIEATSNATIYEFSADIDNTTGQMLIFAVYESDTSDGTYLPIATRVVEEPGTGRRMYSSGPIKKTGTAENITVTAGKFYIFGVAWTDAMYSYYKSYDGIFNPFVSHTTTFGKTLGGTALADSYPLLASIPGTNKGLTNYNMFFNTGSTSTDICICNNLCPALNNTRCNSNWIENCSADAYGCLDWKQHTNCNSYVCEMNNSVAECVDKSAPSQEYIASSGVSSITTDGPAFRGMYLQADKKGVITGFKVHLQQPSGSTGVSVPFLIYEGNATSGNFTRIHRSTHTVGVDGYYGPTGISINLTAGKYYLVGFYAPTGTGVYFINGSGSSPIEFPLKFGKSIGNENISTSTEPSAAYTFDGPYISSYRMWIESYLN